MPNTLTFRVHDIAAVKGGKEKVADAFFGHPVFRHNGEIQVEGTDVVVSVSEDQLFTADRIRNLVEMRIFPELKVDRNGRPLVPQPTLVPSEGEANAGTDAASVVVSSEEAA